MTLYRVPYSIDAARILANRGLLLEALPILRLCLEMIAWAKVAFHTENESDVIALRAPDCITKTKKVYKNAGKIYGYLSKVTHWEQIIHGNFININKEITSVIYASAKYRAMTLALCLIIMDVLVEVVRFIYGKKSNALVAAVQECGECCSERKIFKIVTNIFEKTQLEELSEIKMFLVD